MRRHGACSWFDQCPQPRGRWPWGMIGLCAAVALGIFALAVRGCVPLLLACLLVGQSKNIGGGCVGPWQQTIFPTIGVDQTGTSVLYLFDAMPGPVFAIFDTYGGAQPYYPMPFPMAPFGADPTCFLLVQWCAIIPSALGTNGSFPIPPGFHGSLRCQQILFDPRVPGGFYMSDVAELIL